MKEYSIDERGELRCPTYDFCHNRGICLATPKQQKVEEDEEALKERILALASVELDDLGDPDEIIWISPSLGMPRSEFMRMKQIAEAANATNPKQEDPFKGLSMKGIEVLKGILDQMEREKYDEHGGLRK